MPYIQDWIYYNSGNECPEKFWRWAGLSLLAHVVGRKVFYRHGKFPINCALYVGLIGDAGSGKTSAKSEVKSVIIEHFPQLFYSTSIQSREELVKRMALDECLRVYLTPDGTIHDYRPYYIIANEFENFLSVDPIRMIAFLVDIFDETWFSTGFKNSESQSFQNPYVNMLACGVPDWLMTELRMNLFKGGLGRRLILVCADPTEPVPDPFQPPDFAVVKKRVVEHLQAAYEDTLQGEFVRTEAAKLWWHSWYIPHKKKKPTDPILSQFHSTEHVMVLKIAMLLALNERPFKLVLTDENLAVALAMLQELKTGIQTLTSGIGRNELAGIGAKMLMLIEELGGCVPEVHIRKCFRRYATLPEWKNMIDDYINTKELVIADLDDVDPEGTKNGAIKRRYYFLPPMWEAYLKKKAGVIGNRPG